MPHKPTKPDEHLQTVWGGPVNIVGQVGFLYQTVVAHNRRHALKCFATPMDSPISAATVAANLDFAEKVVMPQGMIFIRELLRQKQKSRPEVRIGFGKHSDYFVPAHLGRVIREVWGDFLTAAAEDPWGDVLVDFPRPAVLASVLA